MRINERNMRSRGHNMRSGSETCEVAGVTCGVARNDAKSRAQHAEWLEKMRSRGRNMLSSSKRCGVAGTTSGFFTIEDPDGIFRFLSNNSVTLDHLRHFCTLKYLQVDILTPYKLHLTWKA